MKYFILSGILLLIITCATYNTLSESSRKSLAQRNYDESLKLLKEACEKEKKNKLLCLYDRGMIHYLKKDYKAAIKDWTKADELAESTDVISVTEQAASFVLDDNTIAYRGEHHERILNSLYLGLSYLFQDGFEDALVECRRMNYKHQKLEQENQKKYKQNAFSKYISGKLFEATGDFNEAFQYYREANKLLPNIPIIENDLLRVTYRYNFNQEYEEYKKEFNFKEKTPELHKDEGELIVILENGESPEKISEELMLPVAGRVVKLVSPKFVGRSNKISHAKIKILNNVKARTYLLNDINNVAIEQLRDRVAINSARMAARLVTKEALAAGVAKATDNQLLGVLVSVGLEMMQRADTRSWLTLPANLQIGVLWLNPGEYEINLDFFNSNDRYLFTALNIAKVKIEKGKKHFVSWRTFE